MSVWTVEVGDRTTTVRADDYALVAPVGAVQLAADVLAGDPPRPEDLTNAIGSMVDHLEDVVRERPDVLGAEVRLSGRWSAVIAAVELGGEPLLPAELPRDALEDVFRTVATEPVVDRRRNPGLDPDAVEAIVGACCIAVAVMRRLHLPTLTVVGAVA